MKLLLHICCAPCSIACIQSLRAEGIEPTGYWYNPNIHPFAEYRERRDTLTEYAKTIGLALEMDDDYGLRPFTRAVAEDIANRCLTCYAARMRQTARYAAEHGFTHFTSTLFISPYQQHELLRAAAEQAAEEFGVSFLYRDFRPVFRSGQEEARALDLYMQKYCGCVYSEEERYSKRFRKKPTKGGVKETAPHSAPVETIEAETLRRVAMPMLKAAGVRFEAARVADTEPSVQTPATLNVLIEEEPRTEVAILTELTERALWEVRNVLRCTADSGLWEKPYGGAPVWRHVYHMLHSLDQWFINPLGYQEPAIHGESLNDLDLELDVPPLSPTVLEAYLAQIADKTRAYLRDLSDAELTARPEGIPYERLALMVGQMRHLHTHMGMLMGFIIAERGEWPMVLGMKTALPMEDDGKPRYY